MAKTRNGARVALDIKAAKAIAEGAYFGSGLTSEPFGLEQQYGSGKSNGEHRLIRLLAAANEENSPEAYQQILIRWLVQQGVEAPVGVFIPSRKTSGITQTAPGRPKFEDAEKVYSLWSALGEPSSKSVLAAAYYGEKYTDADSKTKCALRVNLRHILNNQLGREIIRLQKKSAEQQELFDELKRER
jgi:hypothetical protein